MNPTDLSLLRSVMAVLFLASVSAHAVEPRIGFLRCLDPLFPEKGYEHLFYFQKTAKWKEFRQTVKKQPLVKISTTFDGRARDTLEAEMEETIFKKVPKETEKVCQWLIKHKRLKKIVLTTTLEKFSDPEKWKTAKLRDSQIQEKALAKEVEAFDSCLKPVQPYKGKAFRHFKLGKVYRSANGKRALVQLESLCPEVKDDVLDAWNEGDRPWSVWVFRDETGMLHKKMNLELLDIGDFDGDGDSEAVFFSGYPVPEGNYSLLDLETFKLLAIAHDDGH